MDRTVDAVSPAKRFPGRGEEEWEEDNFGNVL